MVGGGTENHTIVLRLRGGITGSVAQAALEGCGIIVEKKRAPGENRSSFVANGLCIGTGSLAQRRIDPQGCRQVVELIARILDQVMSQSEPKHGLEPAVQAQFRRQTEALCAMYPIADYGER
ncbi:Serine hydroxymethyltransferase 2 [compost metagenome]